MTQTGDITTSGANADAIEAHAEGSGDITITHTGTITASGADSDGIHAQADGAIAIAIALDDSTVTAAAAAVEFAGGSANTLTTRNAVTLNGGSHDILGGDGDETITNHGTLTSTGRIDLGAGANAFNNLDGAVFYPGSAVNLGSGNLFTNAGELSPGGRDTVAATTLTGNLAQTETGSFTVTVDTAAGTADRIEVTGTAALAGRLGVHLLKPRSGSQDNTILSAAGGVSDNGLALQLALSYPNANDVVLITTIDFANVPGLDGNQSAIGRFLQELMALDDTNGLDELLMALLYGTGSLADYQNALYQLLPTIHHHGDTKVLSVSGQFTDSLFSCPVAGNPNGEGECTWLRGEHHEIAYDLRDATGSVNSLTVGIQREVAPDWFTGIGFETAVGKLQTRDGEANDNVNHNLGVTVKYRHGALALGAALGGGVTSIDTTRAVSFADMQETARASYRVYHLGGRLNAGYTFRRQAGYAKPFVDLDLTHLVRESLREEGGGAANLSIAGDQHTFFALSPGVEVGGTFDLGDGAAWQPYLTAGLTWAPDRDTKLQASFVDAPDGMESFAISSARDSLFADLELGVTAFASDGVSLSAAYRGRVSDNSERHGGAVKVTIPF